MKFKIEFNAEELARGISSGALQALIDCDSIKQEAVQNMQGVPEPSAEEKGEPVEEQDQLEPAEEIKLQHPDEAEYSTDQLAKAAVGLMDSGAVTSEELAEMLREYGVTALPSLQPKHFVAFAEKLRQKGAQI